MITYKLSVVSSEPGVYLMKDDSGKVIYVGKALNLKKRLSSYFTKFDQHDSKTKALVQKISDFETIITATESEALILESNLIKQYKPRYNIILKDDKRYPALKIDIKSPYPTLTMVRKIKNDSSIYFGPFTSHVVVRETLNVIRKTFKLRNCKNTTFKNRSRPCLNYQISKCLAPCCNKISKEAYNDIIKEVILFLKGKTSDLIQKIKDEMFEAAKIQEYEKAAILRDKMIALERILEKQFVVNADLKDRDVIGISMEMELSIITVLFIRGGVVTGTRHFTFIETLSNEDEIISSFIRQYYKESSYVPNEILIPIDIEDRLGIEEYLKEIAGEKILVFSPVRGDKINLVSMAMQNAKSALKEKLSAQKSNSDILLRLQKHLKLKTIPNRVECFDNSNWNGKDMVSCMVVFEKGKPKKEDYRRYKIKNVSKPDDYAAMAEVIKRRYGKGEKFKPYPDLLIIDGGKGQLSIAFSILKDLNISDVFDVISIAKKDKENMETEDKIYRPGQLNPINFSREANLLLFLQSIRDESHRFTISYQRILQKKSLFS
ncbi:MAG: excinuclease ABC subunit UvrC [Desulfobacterales bacterium]|nr:excinuclease ABC subunit UvrC [Desulfobacterales bacterium]MBF0396244.1 excinuclease ABC subunit UvrC [Desulfobacterales bacterium]